MPKPITVLDAKKHSRVTLKQIWERRDMIRLIVKRSFTIKYKQTLLGVLWAFINPFITTVVYNIVFGRIAKLSPAGVPSFLFFMSGNLIWGYFSSCFGSNSSVFLSGAGLFSKVYFPRIIIPITNCISSFINFGIQFLFFIGFMIFFIIRDGAVVAPNIYAVLFPVFILQMAMLGVGLGFLASSVTVKYRDLSMVFGFIVSLMMYLSPVVYEHTQMVPPELMKFYMLNPMVTVISGFRYGFLGIGTFELGYYLIGLGTSAVIFLLGLYAFNRTQHDFIDSI